MPDRKVSVPKRRIELVKKLSSTRVLAKCITRQKKNLRKGNTSEPFWERESIREWKLGGTFKDTTCFICRDLIPAGRSAWRESSRNQQPDYRSARVCTECWSSDGVSDPIYIIDRNDVIELLIGLDRNVPHTHLVTTKKTALELSKRIRQHIKEHSQQ